MNFEPTIIKNFYSEDMVALVQYQMEVLKRNRMGTVDTKVFKRLEFHEHPMFKALHELQKARVEIFLERKLKISYNFAAMYFEGEGECPPHTDRPQCKYTVDVCFNQKQPWRFFAKNSKGVIQYFDMQPGDAIILSGTEHEHWREKIQPGNFCDLVFFHYVDTNFDETLNGGLK